MAQIVTTSNRNHKTNPTTFVISLAVILFIAVFVIIQHGKGTRHDEGGIAKEAESAKSTNSVIEVKTETGEVELPKSDNSSSVSIVRQDAASADVVSNTNEYVKKAGRMMLPSGKVITFKPPQEGQTTKVWAENKMWECDSEGDWKDVTPPELFDNPVENQLVGLAVEGGSFVPGLMKRFDDAYVIEILKKDVIINEDDSEEVVLKKQAVVEMKGMILDYIENGGTYAQFIDEMASVAQQERRLRASGIRKVMAMVRAGDIEGAKKFRAEFDQVLHEQQLGSFRLPKRIADILNESN